MADNNEPIMTNFTNTITIMTASTHAPINTPTSITTSNMASSVTTLPTSKAVLTPLEKQLNKYTWADIKSNSGSGKGYTAADEGGKRPVTRKEGKRANIEDI